MKYSCDMIKDILSLYCDNVCSEDSRAAVEEHLKECEACRGELNTLRDTKYTDSLEQEKKNVINTYKRNVKKKFLLVLSVIFMIPVITCFIVNIAVGHRLDWFFIVLTSLAVLGSMVLVPLAVEKKRFLCILTSFTASLLLLLLTCCVYSGGTWFPVAAVSGLFGLSVVFLPLAVRQIPIKGRLADHKVVLVMLIDTALLALLILLCVVGDYRGAFSIMGYCMILPWGLMLVIRYFKINAFFKAGICSVLTGLFLSMADVVTDIIINGRLVNTAGFWNADLYVWEGDLNSNIMLIILLTGIVLGAVFIGCGIAFENRNKEKGRKL